MSAWEKIKKVTGLDTDTFKKVTGLITDKLFKGRGTDKELKVTELITDKAKKKAEEPDPEILEMYERESSLCSEILKLVNGETGLISLRRQYQKNDLTTYEEMYNRKRQLLDECLNKYEGVVTEFNEKSEEVGSMPFRIQLSDDERERYKNLAQSPIKK